MALPWHWIDWFGDPPPRATMILSLILVACWLQAVSKEKSQLGLISLCSTLSVLIGSQLLDNLPEFLASGVASGAEFSFFLGAALLINGPLLLQGMSLPGTLLSSFSVRIALAGSILAPFIVITHRLLMDYPRNTAAIGILAICLDAAVVLGNSDHQVSERVRRGLLLYCTAANAYLMYFCYQLLSSFTMTQFMLIGIVLTGILVSFRSRLSKIAVSLLTQDDSPSNAFASSTVRSESSEDSDSEITDPAEMKRSTATPVRVSLPSVAAPSASPVTISPRSSASATSCDTARSLSPAPVSPSKPERDVSALLRTPTSAYRHDLMPGSPSFARNTPHSLAGDLNRSELSPPRQVNRETRSMSLPPPLTLAEADDSFDTPTFTWRDEHVRLATESEAIVKKIKEDADGRDRSPANESGYDSEREEHDEVVDIPASPFRMTPKRFSSSLKATSIHCTSDDNRIVAKHFARHSRGSAIAIPAVKPPLDYIFRVRVLEESLWPRDRPVCFVIGCLRTPYFPVDESVPGEKHSFGYHGEAGTITLEEGVIARGLHQLFVGDEVSLAIVFRPDGGGADVDVLVNAKAVLENVCVSGCQAGLYVMIGFDTPSSIEGVTEESCIVVSTEFSG
eukprot:TRINITY_DN831_c0_g1_i1.p1 TRINITY_DN831_c0_g1~~TRINITY_DN831_c0_g1_i1.p1  ORF type:complete len:623 (+),score=96.18 TRINITY_DN831_c0_g1_i1:40-1908(+)